jgi:hypothetical protein
MEFKENFKSDNNITLIKEDNKVYKNIKVVDFENKKINFY